MFLQGGPGFAAQRPVGRSTWLDRALDDYRVLLLDQRGTGRSAPATARSLARLGTPAAQARYLAHFRADSIVLDCELVRRELCGPAEPWTVLGQSFGGFCTVTYLSFAPHGMREALITGGLPGLDTSADDVYRLTYATAAARNAAHYERYPSDAESAREVAGHLADRDVRLPDGSPLTVERFQAIGGMLGTSAGTHELHYLLEDPWDGGGGCRTRSSPRSPTGPGSRAPPSTRCCTRPATPRGRRPGGRRSGSAPSSPRSTRPPPSAEKDRCTSPAR